MVRVPPDLYQKLTQSAQENNRPLTWELRRLIEKALAAEREEKAGGGVATG